MRKFVVAESISLDGVFDALTMGKWAQPYYSEERDEVARQNVLAAEALLLGRATYDLQVYFWPNQPKDKYGMADKMNRMPKYVVTSTPLQVPWNNSTTIQSTVVEEIAKLKQQPGQSILIQGSATLVQALMQADLIDEYQFTVHPVIVGTGKRFFKDEMGMARLKLVETKPISLGVVVLTYVPAR